MVFVTVFKELMFTRTHAFLSQHACEQSHTTIVRYIRNACISIMRILIGRNLMHAWLNALMPSVVKNVKWQLTQTNANLKMSLGPPSFHSSRPIDGYTHRLILVNACTRGFILLGVASLKCSLIEAFVALIISSNSSGRNIMSQELS